VQKKVTITIENLDITQLYKIHDCLSDKVCDRNSVSGAYRYELRELIGTIIDNVQENRSVFAAPELTI
jgi:hypothetical protein